MVSKMDVYADAAGACWRSVGGPVTSNIHPCPVCPEQNATCGIFVNIEEGGVRCQQTRGEREWWVC